VRGVTLHGRPHVDFLLGYDSPFTRNSVATTVRIALANLRAAASPVESVAAAEAAIAEAGAAGALLVCFPECFIPGYRWTATSLPAPDAAFLDQALLAVSVAAKSSGVAVVMGTERLTPDGLQISAAVFDADGTQLGWQDKGQLDPSEEFIYPAFGASRRVFTVGALTFGVVICHEGWRYPETVRWAARRGAQVVFHPHASIAEPGGFAPSTYADPRNSFHEKAVLCRAAENTVYFATVNYASEGAGTTSAVANPDGSLLGYQPYGHHGVFLADLDLGAATGLLASRCRTSPL
jgi:predicted amidohydrolase